jgi:hypothetical protein
MKQFCKIFIAAMTLFISTSSFASLIYDIQNNKLTSVSGISFNGQLWNVKFGDSCVSMYSGCTDNSLFAFNSSALAEGALLALYNQAIKDGVNVNGTIYNFDSQTDLMFSIALNSFAEIWVPFSTNGTIAMSVWGYHQNGLIDFNVADRNASWAIDYGFSDSRGPGDREYMAFTSWSLQQSVDPQPVSAPATLSMLGLGLLVITMRRRVAK